ncbi:MAG: amidohydrolase [Clostridiales bacterium]|nr:amidohydrolase [Clostridiales bacterium]
MMNVMDEVLKNREYLVEKRRYFHKHPELSWQEFETAKTIRQELTCMGISYDTVGTSTVATIQGPENKPVIGLRCDIDALPIRESRDSSFRSEKEGVMHACGHDSHIAMLLTAAKILSEHRDELLCTVKLIFQAAEEAASKERAGAMEVLSSGLLDDVDTVCGMHIFPMIPVGKISVDPGARYTSMGFMKIKVIGKAGHGAMPQFSVDPIYVGCKVVDALQSIVSRETNPMDTVVVSVCSFHSGSAANIIDSSATLLGTVRTFNPEIRKTLPEMMERIVKNTCAAYRADYEFEMYADLPATITDERCAAIGREAVVDFLGEEAVYHYPGTPGGEDFSYILERIPGIYAFIGCRNEEKDCIYPLHHDQFDLDEDAMVNGVGFYLEYLLHAQKETW